MSAEKQLPEKFWIRVGVTRLLKGRRTYEMTLSNTSSPWKSEAPFESQRSNGS